MSTGRPRVACHSCNATGSCCEGKRNVADLCLQETTSYFSLNVYKDVVSTCFNKRGRRLVSATISCTTSEQSKCVASCTSWHRFNVSKSTCTTPLSPPNARTHESRFGFETATFTTLFAPSVAVAMELTLKARSAMTVSSDDRMKRLS